MKRFPKPGPILWLVVFLILAVATAGPFLLSALPQAVAASASHRVLGTFVHADMLKSIPVGTPSDRQGTYLVFQDSVFDATETHKLGNETGTCVFTTTTVLACTTTFIFSDGEIAIQGPVLMSGAPSTLVITGGLAATMGQRGR
jgi:hypothetical protein